MIIGGEPLAQQLAVTGLACALAAAGLLVEVETSGTVIPARELCSAVSIFSVSPKLANAPSSWEKGLTAGWQVTAITTGAQGLVRLCHRESWRSTRGHLIDEKITSLVDDPDPVLRLITVDALPVMCGTHAASTVASLVVLLFMRRWRLSGLGGWQIG